MKEDFTEGALNAFANILEAECMACKKARLYANTLTDSMLAERMQSLADNHAARFAALFSLLTEQ